MSQPIHKSVYIIVGLQNGSESRISIDLSAVHRNYQSRSTKCATYDASKVFNKKLERSVSMVSGLYFKRTTVDFGDVIVGSLSRLKAELCNSTDHTVRCTVYTIVDSN